MKTSIKKLPKSKVELLVELSKEEFDHFYEKVIFELGENLELPGFRKGNIPKEVILKNVDQRMILDRAAEEAIRENYLKVIFENKIETLGRPKVEILKLVPGNSFEFKILVSVFPEIKLADYKKIASQKEKRKVSVSEKEVEDTLSLIQRSRTKLFPKDGPSQKGDFIEIEYASPQIEGGRKIKDGFFLGKGGFVAGFEEKLEGMKKDEERNFSLKIPENYFQKSLAGKEISFKVKTISVQRAEIPELTDEFAKSLGKFENLSDLKKSIFEGIEMEKEKAESEKIREEILNEIIENSEFEIPEILVEEEKNRYLEELKIQIPQIFKISFKDYLTQIKKTEEELKNSYQKKAEKEIQKALILREIRKREKIEVSDEEVLEKANEILLNFTPDQIKKIDPKVLKEYTKERVEEEKVLNFLESQAK
jgi:trigger factor